MSIEERLIMFSVIVVLSLFLVFCICGIFFLAKQVDKINNNLRKLNQNEPTKYNISTQGK